MCRTNHVQTEATMRANREKSPNLTIVEMHARIARLEAAGKLNLYVAPFVFLLIALIIAFFLVTSLSSGESKNFLRLTSSSISIVVILVGIFITRRGGARQLMEANELRKTLMERVRRK